MSSPPTRNIPVPIGETFDATLRAAKDGADWAWAAFYRELAGTVIGYLASRGAAEPEDLASETFLQVARNIHGFEGDEASFRSWVFVIAHRRLLDARRSQGRRPRLSSLDGVEEAAGGNVETDALKRLVTEELEEAMAKLTDDQRDVLALRIIANLTLEETAQVVGKGVGAVKAVQRRALLALRAHIDLEGVSQ
jgi:RNA polymerase sigma factor (sigma-70 family)